MQENISTIPLYQQSVIAATLHMYKDVLCIPEDCHTDLVPARPARKLGHR
jgi:hypothetical protein